MKDLLRLFFLSLLFTEGVSLECEICTAHTTTCSGKRQFCLPSQDACISWVTESAMGTVAKITASKDCSTQLACNFLKHGVTGWIGKSRTDVKNVQCSKALVPSGSIFLVVFGFLFLKLLV